MNKKRLIAAAFGVPFDSDYQAILNRATALGYTLPSAAQQVKQNTFLVALKTAGVWNLLDILYVYATDGNSDFATLNWKAPTLFQCAKVNSPTFTTNQGFTGNGSTSYVNSNWSAFGNGVNYTQNNASMGGYVNSNIAESTGDVWGIRNGANQAELNPRTGGNVLAGSLNALSAFNAANANSIGFYHSQRTAVNLQKVFKNGVLLDTKATASAALGIVSLTACCSNFIPGPLAFNFSSRQIGLLFAGAGLAGLELSFYNAWNTYFTSL